jgi:hypothetical protein
MIERAAAHTGRLKRPMADWRAPRGHLQWPDQEIAYCTCAQNKAQRLDSFPWRQKVINDKVNKYDHASSAETLSQSTGDELRRRPGAARDVVAQCLERDRDEHWVAPAKDVRDLSVQRWYDR